MEKKRRSMRRKKERETEYKKKKAKIAKARKPETFVWTDNEVELLHTWLQGE